MNLFTIAPEDQSLNYLNIIFGPVGSGVLGGVGPVTLMGAMFQTFNTMALTIGAFIVVYVTLMGVIMTAHEGEFLGKKFQSIWLPIRMVLGIAGLVPISNGYCAIQIVIMWIIVQGIGAADTLWGTVLNYVQMNGSVFAATTPDAGIKNNLGNLFQALVCQETAKARFPMSSPGQGNTGTYWCANSGSSWCSETQTAMLDIFSGPHADSSQQKYWMGPSGNSNTACGSLQYCNNSTVWNSTTPANSGLCATDPNNATTTGPNSAACLACNAQRGILQNIVTMLDTVAAWFVLVDYQYRNFYLNGGQAPSWVANYCGAQSPPIPTAQCCHAAPNAGGDSTSTTQGACNNGQLNFAIGTSSSDYNNTANNTVTSLYWPYVLSSMVSINAAQGGSYTSPGMQTAVVRSAGAAASGGSGNFIDIISSYYITTIKNAVLPTVTQSSSNDTISRNVYNKGWVGAGVYYYAIAGFNHQTALAANPQFQVQATDPGSTSSGNALSGYLNDFQAAGSLISYIQGGTDASSVAQLNAFGTLAGSGNSINYQFTSMITGGTAGQPVLTPLSNLQAFGEGLLIAVQVIFFVYLALAVIIAIVGGFISTTVLGTGVPGEATFLEVLFMLLNPIVFFLLGILFGIGSTLAIYVPLIPYVVFTVGVLGWFIQSIEAMVAGPLIALGILAPSGQHELLGKAEPALMMLFNLFLRPSLMVFGLMAALFMSVAAVTMINAGIGPVISSIMSPGLLEILLFMGAYVSLIVTALNKCFSLVWILPDRILTWIGGQAVSYGEAGEALSAVKSGVEGAAGGIMSAKGMGEAAIGVGKTMGIATETAKKKKAAQIAANQPPPPAAGGGGAPPA